MSKSILLVIDYINDIVHPDGKCSSCAGLVQKNNVIATLNQAITFARKQNIEIFQVKVGFSPSYVECSSISPIFSSAQTAGALQLGTWGTEFHSDMKVAEEDTVMVKHRVSALYATPLEAILRAQGVEQVYIAGVSTSNAVESTARELHDRDYKVVVLSDACAAATEQAHQASLMHLERIAQVKTVEQWIKAGVS